MLLLKIPIIHNEMEILEIVLFSSKFPKSRAQGLIILMKNIARLLPSIWV